MRTQQGRADNHPKQHSEAPVIQVDITYYTKQWVKQK